MKNVVIVAVIITILVLSLTSLGYAESKTFVFDGEFKGPFVGTSINRFYDPDYNVVCYLYIPDTVSIKQKLRLDTESGKTSNSKIITSFAGNISCVKVK